MSLPEEYPALAQLLACYFPDGAQLTPISFQPVMQAHLNTASRQQLEALEEDLRELMSSDDQMQLFELALKELEIHFAEPSQGLTVNQWLAHAFRLTRERLDPLGEPR